MIALALFIILLLLVYLCSPARRRRRDWCKDTVIITGGCGNIGRAMKQALDLLGAKVYLLDVVDGHDEKDWIECDVTDCESIKRALDCIGIKPTILINNCGAFNGQAFKELHWEDFARVMRVNFDSYVLMTRHCLPLLEKGSAPYIVNVASCLALAGVPLMTDYCASKFAVYGFNEALRMELKCQRSRIRTLIVCPFFVRHGLFPDIKLRMPWITRALTATEVAEAIIRGIENGQEEIWMPWFTHLVPLFRLLLPAWILDHCQFLLGTHQSLLSVHQPLPAINKNESPAPTEEWL